MNNPQQSANNPQPPGYYSHPPFPEEESFDIKRYISLFLSNWYWFAVALFISLSIAYGINRYSEKVYTVSSTMLIKDEQVGGGMSGIENIIPGGDIFKSHQNLQNEIGILKSFSLNYNVMKELPDFWVSYVGVGRRRIAENRHYKDGPFKVVFDSLYKQTKNARIDIEILSDKEYRMKIGDQIDKKMNFGDIYSTIGFNFALIIRRDFIFDNVQSNKYYFWFERIEGLANLYRGKLGVSPIEEEASLIRLTTTGVSTLQETDYLNKLMEVYINRGLDLKNQTAEKTIEFINEQLNLISDSLTLAEIRLENFRLTNSLIDLSSEASLLQTRIVRYENEKYIIELEKQYYEYLIEYINSKDESGDIVSPSIMGVSDPGLSRLVGELASLQLQKKQLSFSLSGELPAVNLMDSQIEDARNILRENVKNSINNVKRLLVDINARIVGVEQNVQKLPGTERRLINIQRKFDLNNTVYTYLMEKRAEAGIAKASNISDNRVIDQAKTFNSNRVGPKEKKNYMMAFIFGLLIPTALIFLLDLLNNKVIDKKDIEKATTVPILGYIGHNENKSEIPIFENPGSTLAESFRSIRTSLKFFSEQAPSNTITVTSTISGEGKTFISVNLASIIAMLGKKVLIVGLDLRKPKLHKIFNTNNGTGLTTYLIGETGYEDIIQKTDIDNLFFTTSGPIPPNPAELIDSDRMGIFFKKAKEEYDYIIIDTPPVAIVTDTLLLAPYVNINLFIVRQRYSSKNTLELINDLYKQGELKNLSIIVNDISLSGYYGYGLRYGNTLGYRSYTYGYNLYGEYGYRKYAYGKEGKGYYSGEK